MFFKVAFIANNMDPIRLVLGSSQIRDYSIVQERGGGGGGGGVEGGRHSYIMFRNTQAGW